MTATQTYRSKAVRAFWISLPIFAFGLLNGLYKAQWYNPLPFLVFDVMGFVIIPIAVVLMLDTHCSIRFADLGLPRIGQKRYAELFNLCIFALVIYLCFVFVVTKTDASHA